MICGAYNKSEKAVEKVERDCCICIDDCTNSSCVIFKCGHFLCGDCWIHNSIVGVSKLCPLCRSHIEIDKITGDKSQFSDQFIDICSIYIRNLEKKYTLYSDKIDYLRQMNDLGDELLHANVDYENAVEEYSKVVKIIIELSNLISQHK